MTNSFSGRFHYNTVVSAESEVKYVLEMIKLILIVVSLQFINAANILVLDTQMSPSHHLWTRVLVNGLAENDVNNITVLSLIPDTKKHRANIHYIHLENVYEYVDSKEEFDYMESVNNPRLVFFEYHTLDASCIDACFG